MLKSLSIKNYALIDHLEIDFSEGLSVITGETGSGKSILLGALGLVLGNRADVSSIKNKVKKCVVEVVFYVEKYSINKLFDDNDLDYENLTTIRREVLPNGKSRAFVNDTPTTLKVLQELGNHLIDIHSQNQTYSINDASYQFYVLDTLAKNGSNIATYKAKFEEFKTLNNRLKSLLTQKEEDGKDQEYNTFLYKELVEANLKEGAQEELEQELETLSHVENIRASLGQILGLYNHDEIGVDQQLNEMISSSQKIASLSKRYQDIANRLSSVGVEFDDIIRDIEDILEGVSDDPERLNEVSSQLQTIYSLQQKHHVTTVEELCEIRNKLESKVVDFEEIDGLIEEKQKEIKALQLEVTDWAIKIEKSRKEVIPSFNKKVGEVLSRLGMANAKIDVQLDRIPEFVGNGFNTINFLFTANKGSALESIKKVASGGELSRLMLVIKSILASNSQLPTIIFDEIDTGVSGDVANKMGEVMREMSAYMQVFSITHLPQVAGKGKQHYKVFKSTTDQDTYTELKLLTDKERVAELAEMLSGKDITESALIHAKSLLN